MNLYKSIKRHWHLIKQDKRVQQDFAKQSSNNSSNHFALYNWWDDYSWLATRYQDLLSVNKKKINFCSVFGQRDVISKVTGIKVFFSGENVHSDRFNGYSDYLLMDKTTNLGLGFDYFENDRYIRFPLWIQYMFEPNCTRDDLINKCRELRYPNVTEKKRFCSMVASHDPQGLRSIMVNKLEGVDTVSCAGKYLHNDNSLKQECGDDKVRYLKDFLFNICPENSNSCGYVTEKIFQAISAGCIPIYWGSYNDPEPLIVNQKAVLFWNKDGDNDDVVRQVERLYSHPNELNDFLRQPRLLDGAEDVIWDMFEKLDAAISRLIKG